MFVDRVVIYVKGGDGGRGCCSFRREKYVPGRAPTAATAATAAASSSAPSPAPTASPRSSTASTGAAQTAARQGGGAEATARNGQDLVIPVPPGTIVYDRERGNILRDLTEAGEQVVVGHGGRGGRGNKAFATATNRTPARVRARHARRGTLARPGTESHRRRRPDRPAQRRQIDAAQPAVAGPPGDRRLSVHDQAPESRRRPCRRRTGLRPGRLARADRRGRSGVGLGHEFLRHVERTRVLVHLVEPMPLDGSDPVQNYRMVRRELELYRPALADKPEVIAVSKSELTGSEEVRAAAGSRSSAGRCLAISAVTGQGLPQLVGAIS